ncbi:hypothetical protein EGW08_019577 [Elysia chlorotica]|uniref:Glutaredoxin domain-containing protein n=1 Tax=Elysia chlorotica TaxID=188477 RepID=A0A433STU3_ELYCH|nr:hypothetical protein EGW08_019577 [Elysia chlorotica]
MFRNFVDPPSLDRTSLNENSKRGSHHVTNSESSHTTNGGSNGVQSNDSQIFYRHNGETTSQPNGSQNGGYTTSIIVGTGTKNGDPRLSKTQPNSQYQQQQSLVQQQYLDQQCHQQNNQYYINADHRQQIPQHEQNGYNHLDSLTSDQFHNYSDRHVSTEDDMLYVQQRLASTSIHDPTILNGTARMPSSSGMLPNHHPGSNPELDILSHHQSFPNVSYPSAMVIPSHGDLPHANPTRGHALGSIMENDTYEDDAEDAFSNHLRQQQAYSHQHHQHHQQQQQQHPGSVHLQQTHSAKFVPPTRPQQSWGSGWALPPSALGSEALPSGAPAPTKYHVIPPPPPLTESIFVGRRDVRRPGSVHESQIVSEKGTVRGFKNRVRAGIATFWAQPQDPRNFRQLEQGKIVVYATSMSVVRETSERCKSVRHLLQNHMVRYEERDLYMSREVQQELSYRLKQEGVSELRLPHVFADGIHLGVSKCNIITHITIVFPLQKIQVRIMCERCGGYRFVPCDVCHGSKRSLLRNHFTEEFCALRCMHCNESGLKRCDLCLDQQE